jgi:hypothetical protein
VNELLTGGLVGVGISALLFAFDYMMIRKYAAERAKRNHQTEVRLDATEKRRISALLRFCLAMPVVLAVAWWAISKA